MPLLGKSIGKYEQAQYNQQNNQQKYWLFHTQRKISRYLRIFGLGWLQVYK